MILLFLNNQKNIKNYKKITIRTWLFICYTKHCNKIHVLQDDYKVNK